ncbi:hypothetical protein GCM10017579_10440 [Nocardioides luteus]|uniref:DUF445 domain-containing protein n=1 Tax=Nocardioides luteus TaxID=1844 RepID=A0ABQ5STT8_9ACTN|nr:hypothetical protein GCM10017579_10440 [Nocardioides luteus]
MGWISTAIGFALTVGGLWWTARAMQIAHDDPDGVLMWSWVGSAWDQVVKLMRRKRPPEPITGAVFATLPGVGIADSIYATMRTPIEDSDDLETKVAKLIRNFGHLEDSLKQQATRHDERMTGIEDRVTTHREHVAALEERLQVAEQQEQAKWAEALPMEALGLAAAGLGQVFTLGGAILLAI